MSSTSWDAATYDRVSDVQQAWAQRVLERLALRGDETVLDAGCGSGAVTRRLLDRLPRGRVIAVDVSEEMVAHARAVLGARATVLRADLARLEPPEAVDAVFSNAVFHWVLDHGRLFEGLRAALRPGGPLVAQCGGAGNLERFWDCVAGVASQARFARHLAGMGTATHFAGVAETEERLRAAGFTDVRVWLERSDVTPRDPAGFVGAVNLRCHLERLPADLRGPFVDAVLERAGEPLVLDYRRLNIDARRPGRATPRRSGSAAARP